MYYTRLDRTVQEGLVWCGVVMGGDGCGVDGLARANGGECMGVG